MATYYVNSDTGSDSNSGVSQNYPYKTFAKALDAAETTDTIRLKGGLNYEITGDSYNFTSLRSFVGDKQNPVIIWTNPTASDVLISSTNLNFTAYNITFRTNLTSSLTTASFIRCASNNGTTKVYNCIFDDPYINSFINDIGYLSTTIYNSIFRNNILVLKNNNFIGDNDLITIYNSIIDNCGIYQISRFTGSNNCLFGFDDFGTSNVTTDPLFIDVTNYDYRLNDDSDCLGAGTTTQNGTNLYSPPASNTTTNDIGVYGGENMLEYIKSTSSTYCCSTNLTKYYANIDEFDLKKELMEEWAVHDGNIDKYTDSGTVVKLYRDGNDLGAAQASIVACDADEKWFYDSGTDTLYCYNANGADTYEFQTSPLSWSDAKTAAISDGAQWLESFLDNRFPRPVPKNDDGNYDFVLERANGIMACILLVRSTQPDSTILQSLSNELFNDTETGLIDLLVAGKIKLAFELTKDESNITEGTLNASTTGFPAETVGTPAIDYEKFKIKIGTGGTLTTGTKNETVTYIVYDLEGNTVNAEDYITGYFQALGSGILVRFAPGVYTANDFWFCEVKGTGHQTQTIRSIRVTR